MTRAFAVASLCLLASAAIAAPPQTHEARKSEPAVGSRSESVCVGQFHDALRQIYTAQYPTISDAVSLAQDPAAGLDPSLPGALIFTPPMVRRSPEEMKALQAAATLARSRGRSTFPLNAENKWVAGRLRQELRDYLTQEATPYLCGNVEDYVATLRAYVQRLGRTPTLDAQLLDVQLTAAGTAVEKALPSPISDTGMPDLASEAGRLAALDRLVGGAQPSDMPAPAADAPAPDTGSVAPNRASLSPSRPVIARLMDIRRMLLARPATPDTQDARRRTVAALSAIEALDYLDHAHKAAPDPLPTSIDSVLDAILKAHGESCTCKS